MIYLMTNQILISQIEEVAADIGEPDCKMTEPLHPESVDLGT